MTGEDLHARQLSHLRASVDLAVRRPEDARADRRAVSDLPQHHRRGLRQSLRRVGELIPLATHEVPTGTQVFDWTVPKEWNIADAYIKDPDGRRVVDFRDNNLHVVNYSAPVNARMSLGELRPHLHSLPERPDWIPYRTTYYAETWGFCLPHRQLESLSDGEYEVVDRLLAARRSAHLWRVRASRRDRGRGPDLDAYLPSIARQRQSVRRRGRGGARSNPGAHSAPLHLSLSLRAGDHRPDRVARAQSGQSEPDQARPGAGLRRRSGQHQL